MKRGVKFNIFASQMRAVQSSLEFRCDLNVKFEEMNGIFGEFWSRHVGGRYLDDEGQ